VNMALSGDNKSYAIGAAVGVVIGVGLALAPSLWKRKGTFTGINRATAGARSQRDLPVGKHPLQLYSMATPNGQKVTIALEELGVEYDAWRIDIMKEDQFSSGFVAVNPNSKIPAMVDRSGDKPLRLFESGSILLHLADKYGKLMPKEPALRAETISWLFCQVGSAPFFGQFGHFWKYAPEQIPYAKDRYKMETQRILDVLDQHLAEKKYLVGEEFTIADIAWFPWVRGLAEFYKARDLLGLDKYKALNSWLARISERPAVQRGLKINSQEQPERH